jgi:protein-tyrosine phosphatase
MPSTNATLAPTYVPAPISHDAAALAERASVVRSELHDVSNAPRGALRAVFESLARAGQNIRNAFVFVGNALTSCFRPAADTDDVPFSAGTPVLVAGGEKQQQLSMELFQILPGESSKRLTPFLTDPPAGQLAPPLPADGHNLFRALSANLQFLKDQRISDHQLSDALLARVKAVESGVALNGMTCEQIQYELNNTKCFDILSTVHARAELRNYVGQVRSVLVDLAVEFTVNQGGNPDSSALVRQMEALYPDQRINELVDKLGLAEVDSPGERAILLNDTRYEKLSQEHLGARYESKTNVATRVQLNNGEVYSAANHVQVGDTEAILCCYPRQQDLPMYLEMLKEKAGVLNVLTPDAEIEAWGFPNYFAKNGEYGGYSVVSTPSTSFAVGALHVNVYNLAISVRGEDAPTQILVNHVTNWDDFKGVDSWALREFARRVDEENENGFLPVIHCRGGMGRAGTLEAAMAINAGMTAYDAISALRVTRSPDVVQTVEQVSTLVNVERLREIDEEVSLERQALQDRDQGQINAAFVDEGV